MRIQSPQPRHDLARRQLEMCKTPNQLNHWQYLNVNKVPEPKTQQKAQEKVQMDSPVKEPSVEQPYTNILGGLFQQVLQKVTLEMN